MYESSGVKDKVVARSTTGSRCSLRALLFSFVMVVRVILINSFLGCRSSLSAGSSLTGCDSNKGEIGAEELSVGIIDIGLGMIGAEE